MSGYTCRETYYNYGSYLRSRGYDQAICNLFTDIQAGKVKVGPIVPNGECNVTINGDVNIQACDDPAQGAGDLSVTGKIIGNLTGNVSGDVTGDVSGDVTGNLTGNVMGNLTGNVTGDVTGVVKGNLIGNVTGDVTGDVLKANTYLQLPVYPTIAHANSAIGIINLQPGMLAFITAEKKTHVFDSSKWVALH